MDRNRELEALCHRDLLIAFKMGPSDEAPSLKIKTANLLANLPAKKFAQIIQAADEEVKTKGFLAAGQYLLERFTRQVKITGAQNVPPTGPVIVASNHPGMMDAMAVWTAMARPDLRIIAAQRDLLNHMPHLKKFLIEIRPQPTSAAREAIQHLNQGGAILTFPAGKIEPDANLRPGAVESLQAWSPSVTWLRDRVPASRLVPVFVQGVISEPATRAPFLSRLPSRADRDWAAATLQIVFRNWLKVSVSVEFGAPVCGDIAELRKKMEDLMHSTPYK